MYKFKNQNGQSLVEFALVIPLLLLILMGIIEFGLMFSSFITITNASREGARLASLGGSDAAIEERVELVAQNINVSNISVTIEPNLSNRTTGEMVTVLVEYDYVMFSPIISNILSPFINLESETIMRVE